MVGQADSIEALLQSVQRHIADHGGELLGVEELRAGLRRGREPAATTRLGLPAPRVWLLPTAAGAKYGDVWIAKTKSGPVALVKLTNFARKGRRHRHWYGVNILTGRKAEIVKVLDGTRR